MAQQISAANTMVVQHQGPPEDLLLMKGKALRIGDPKNKNTWPTVPKLVSVAGKRVEEVKVRTDGPKALACFFGWTVYGVRWAILYRVLDGYLFEIPVQKNPALCCEDALAE